MRKADVLEEIARERSRLLYAIDVLGAAAATTRITEEGWTAKDVLAHLIHYAGQVAFALGAPLQPPAYVLNAKGRLTADEWNALAVAHYRGAPLQDVRDEFERVMHALVERARLRSDDDMLATGAVPWAGERPLWQLIAGDTFLHFAEHASAIEMAPAR